MMSPRMERCVALLRGINVGGVKLSNAQLVFSFERQGFVNVRAVLASGNIAFDLERLDSTGTERRALARTIEVALSLEFHYEARLVLETQERLRRIAAAYPFERDDALRHPYVIFSSLPDVLKSLFDGVKQVPRGMDSVTMGDGILYWRVPKGSSLDSPFAKALARKEYAPHLTTRNLRTVEKLVRA